MLLDQCRSESLWKGYFLVYVVKSCFFVDLWVFWSKVRSPRCARYKFLVLGVFSGVHGGNDLAQILQLAWSTPARRRGVTEDCLQDPLRINVPRLPPKSMFDHGKFPQKRCTISEIVKRVSIGVTHSITLVRSRKRPEATLSGIYLA